MSKIITISREFGSGGRELGKRLAEALGVPCYDYQIIEMVAEKQGLDKDYVENASERDIRAFYPTTIGVRFSASTFFSIKYAILLVSTLVLPEPAPANTNIGPLIWVTASLCSLFNPFKSILPPCTFILIIS